MARRTPPLISLGLPFRIAVTIGLGVITYLASQNLDHPVAERTPLVPLSAPPAQGKDSFEERIDAVTKAIETMKLPFPLPHAIKEPQGAGRLQWVHRRYDILLPKPADVETLERPFEPLRQAFPQAVVQDKDIASGKQIAIGIDGLRTHTIEFHWLERRPRLTLIVDELGDDLLIVRDLLALDVPLTFVVTPFRAFAQASGQRITMASRELLLALPNLAAMATPSTREPRPTATAGMQDEGLRLLEKAFAELPQVAGVKSNPASPIAAKSARGRWLLQKLKTDRLFLFADSVAADSLCEAATELGCGCVRAAERIDGEDETALRIAFSRLLETVQRQGDVIASVPARPALVAALQAELPRFREAGVEIVAASRLLRSESLSHH